MQSSLVDCQIDPDIIQSKYLLLEIDTIKMSLLFMMKHINDGVAYLMTDRYSIIFILMIDT